MLACEIPTGPSESDVAPGLLQPRSPEGASCSAPAAISHFERILALPEWATFKVAANGHGEGQGFSLFGICRRMHPPHVPPPVSVFLAFSDLRERERERERELYRFGGCFVSFGTIPFTCEVHSQFCMSDCPQ